MCNVIQLYNNSISASAYVRETWDVEHVLEFRFSSAQLTIRFRRSEWANNDNVNNVNNVTVGFPVGVYFYHNFFRPTLARILKLDMLVDHDQGLMLTSYWK